MLMKSCLDDPFVCIRSIQFALYVVPGYWIIIDMTLQGSQPHGPVLFDSQLKPKPANDLFERAKSYNKPHVIGAHIRPATACSQLEDFDGKANQSKKLSGRFSRLDQPAWLEDYHCSSPSIPSTHNPLKERHHNMTL